jgi:cell division septum initiation protein DivIVA
MAIDILHLLDRLETQLSKGWRLPFTSNLVIDEDSLLDIIDQMRISIPEEVKQAKRVAAERERMLEQSRQEADRIVTMAQQQVGSLTSEHEVVKSAQEKAEEILAEANRSAGEIRAEADTYVMDVLSDMEEQLLRLITTVRNGIQQVERSAAVRGRERPKRDSAAAHTEAQSE